MDTRRSDWQEDKQFTEEHERDMALNKYNNHLNSSSLYNKDPQYYQILDLVGVNQKHVYDSDKSSQKYHMYPTKGETATSAISHPEFWKIQKVEWETKLSMESNIGRTSNNG